MIWNRYDYLQICTNAQFDLEEIDNKIINAGPDQRKNDRSLHFLFRNYDHCRAPCWLRRFSDLAFSGWDMLLIRMETAIQKKNMIGLVRLKKSSFSNSAVDRPATTTIREQMNSADR